MLWGQIKQSKVEEETLGCYFTRMVREGLANKVAFEHKPEGSEGTSHKAEGRGLPEEAE